MPLYKRINFKPLDLGNELRLNDISEQALLFNLSFENSDPGFEYINILFYEFQGKKFNHFINVEPFATT